jgi:signal transduction histidine kinase/ligand-binding sensor domain-containing protein
MAYRTDNHIWIFLLIGAILLFHSTHIHSQPENYDIEPLPKKAELSESTVYCALQDNEGFMWLGTRTGLYRFDGVDYKAYYHNLYDPMSLSGSVIEGITEDSANYLWITSTRGLDRYDKYSDRINRMVNTVGLSPFWDMLDDGQGNIWLATWASGLLRFDKRSGKILQDVTYEPTDTARRWEMRELLMDSDGIIWIYADGPRFWRYDPGSGSYEEISDVPCTLGNLLQDQSGRIWVTSACGLYLFDKETKLFERQLNQPENPDRLKDDKVCSILEGKDGNLWITTFDGVYKYSPGLKLLYHWPYQNPYPPSLSYWYYHGLIYEDNDETIWIFNPDGMFKLRRRHENFKVINPDPPSTNDNLAVYVLNENILLYGTTKGYYEYNLRDKTFTEFNLSNTMCICIFKDSHGILWIGTRNGLYRRIESDDQTVEHIAYHHIPGDSSSLPGNYVHIITEDSSGRLWIGCQLAMPCYYDRENDRFVHLVDKPSKSLPPFPSAHEPYIFHETSDHSLIAAASGAYKIIPPFTRISDHAIIANDIIEIIPWKPFLDNTADLYVSCLDRRGNVWFGCMTMGLFKWEDDSLHGIHSKGEWTHYSKMDGLAGNFVMRIEEDLDGNIWIGATTGLSRFDPDSETFTNFFTQDGLPSNMFSKSGTRSPNGQLYFGTYDGLISFHPDSLRLNATIPPIKLTSFKINNQEVIPGEKSLLGRSVQFTDEVKLPHNLNTFSISFAVLNYIEPERNQHKYMMVGLDEDWVFSGLNNNVTYANLKPGKYTFRATGSNNDGVWNEEGVALSIRVKAPPWLKWWAYLIYGMILTGMVLLYRYYLLSRAKLRTDLEVERIEKDKVLEIEKMKSQFFTNISHEFRTPLSLILGPINDIQKRQDKLEEGDRKLLSIMKRNAGRLQKLINQLLDLSKLETGTVKLQVQEGDLSGFIRSIVLSFLSLAETRQIDYQFDIQNTSGRIYYDADKIEKILTNLVSNAFKFTPEGGKIKVGLKYNSDEEENESLFAEISVCDSGKGIPSGQIEKIFDRFYQVSSSDTREKEGTGIGLSLTRELINIYRGEITVDSKPGKGSKFIVTLPVSRDLFDAGEVIPAPSGKQRKMETSQGEIFEDLHHDVEYQPETLPESNKGRPVILIVEEDL